MYSEHVRACACPVFVFFTFSCTPNRYSHSFCRKGDSTKLRVGILVNSTSEMLDKQSAESARLHAAAGPGLAEECR